MLQDLEDRNYAKITCALAEAVVARPWFLISKKSKLHPGVTVLKKLYGVYRVAKTVFPRGDARETGNALQSLTDFYESNAPLIRQV